MTLKSFGLALAATTVVAGAAMASEGMVAYTITDEVSIEDSLTGAPGDAAKGEKVVENRKLGNCLACHVISTHPNQLFHGEVGPSLDGVASRYSEGELRLQVVNSKELNPDTIMPAFYRTGGLTRVRKDLVGVPILTAEEVEDVVAYLLTLTEE